jgi:hypothetical protein
VLNLKSLRFSAYASWHLLSSLSHSIYFSRLSSQPVSSLLVFLISFLLLTGVSYRFIALSNIFISFCSSKVFFSGLMLVCEQMLLIKKRVEAYSFSSSRLFEREWLLLLLKRFIGWRKKDCISLKKEVSSSLFNSLKPDLSFFSLYIFIIILPD